MRKRTTRDIAAFDEQGSLMAKTKELLKNDPRTLEDIAFQCHIPYYWVARFSSGTFKNPSVNRVQYPYEQLSGKKLAV